LVYQHSLIALALPIKLILPTQDLVLTINDKTNGNATLLKQNNLQSPPQQQQQQQQQSQSQQSFQSQHQQQQQQNQDSPFYLLEKGAGK
jgi:stringent starvation protein B